MPLFVGLTLSLRCVRSSVCVFTLLVIQTIHDLGACDEFQFTKDITPVTSAGKLVVCGSILVGVAVIPAQAAALVEAFLERQRQLAKNNRNTGFIPRPSNERYVTPDSERLVDPLKKCTHCGTSFHWTSARYCHSCGESL